MERCGRQPVAEEKEGEGSRRGGVVRVREGEVEEEEEREWVGEVVKYGGAGSSELVERGLSTKTGTRTSCGR